MSDMISEETKQYIKDTVDTMCGLMSEMNSMNYDMFIKTREDFMNKLSDMVSVHKLHYSLNKQ